MVFEQVITAENLTADEIFIRVKDWYGQALRDQRSVITYDNRETGKINGIFQKKFTRMKSFGSYIYTPFRSSVNIDIKDNRFKLTCFDFEDLKGSPMNQYLYKKNGEFRKSYYPLYNDLMDTITGLYESILNYVNNYEVDDTW
nr:DUF4468 domain-containing protein [Bacteroidota bacterium]